MPNNYMEVKVIKRKSNKLSKSIKGVFLLVFVLLIGFVFADVFSNAVVLGDFSLSALFSKDSIKLKSITLYALSLGEYTTIDEANLVANTAGTMGAGAYVWAEDNKYYVMGSIYKSKNDCEKVIVNLTNTNYFAKVKEIKLKKINFEISNISNEDKETVKSALSQLYNVYQKVYDVAIKVDTSEITNIAACNLLNALNSDIKINNASLKSLNAEYQNEKLLKIIQTYSKINDSLENCINQLLVNKANNYVIKYTLCESVYYFSNLTFNL